MQDHAVHTLARPHVKKEAAWLEKFCKAQRKAHKLVSRPTAHAPAFVPQSQKNMSVRDRIIRNT